MKRWKRLIRMSSICAVMLLGLLQFPAQKVYALSDSTTITISREDMCAWAFTVKNRNSQSFAINRIVLSMPNTSAAFSGGNAPDNFNLPNIIADDTMEYDAISSSILSGKDQGGFTFDLVDTLF